MDPRALQCWARTELGVDPEPYVFARLDAASAAAAAAALAASESACAVWMRTGDELTIACTESLARSSPALAKAEERSGPYRRIALDVEVPLDVCGYLAPAAQKLADAGIAILPFAAWSRDHLLVRADQLELALRTLERWIASCRAAAG
ncbi:MAG: ACT domain-containing protein [Planctomycetes bacterium]|nr:ACT domain-containing protein [Planctomycetota bacterium]